MSHPHFQAKIVGARFLSSQKKENVFVHDLSAGLLSSSDGPLSFCSDRKLCNNSSWYALYSHFIQQTEASESVTEFYCTYLKALLMNSITLGAKLTYRNLSCEFDMSAIPCSTSCDSVHLIWVCSGGLIKLFLFEISTIHAFSRANFFLLPVKPQFLLEPLSAPFYSC